MTRTKREIAIASVDTVLHGALGDSNVAIATTIVDQLIRDGVIVLGYAGDPETAAVLDYFQMHVGTTTASRLDRYAAKRLTKRYGETYVLGLIQAYSERKTERYAPAVNTVLDLERRLPQIQRFITTEVEAHHGTYDI